MKIGIITSLAFFAIAVSAIDVKGQSKNISALMQNRVIDDTYHGESTNGLGCDVQINYRQVSDNYHEFPACSIFVFNQSTNSFHFLKLPTEALCNIELFDSAGKPIAKTVIGQKYGAWKPKQIFDWEVNQPKQDGGQRTYFGIWAKDSTPYGSFSVPEVFEIKQPGEYMLHLRMRLAKNGPRSPESPVFFITYLPEIAAKVEIRPEDIVSTNSVLEIQTNVPPK